MIYKWSTQSQKQRETVPQWCKKEMALMQVILKGYEDKFACNLSTWLWLPMSHYAKALEHKNNWFKPWKDYSLNSLF